MSLNPPEKIMQPRVTPLRSCRTEVTTVKIGQDNEARIERVTYDNKRFIYRLMVPCEDSHHCYTCECGSNHVIFIEEEQIGKLRNLLAT